MEFGVKGCEVVVFGKFCVVCVKFMKFIEGFMVYFGQFVCDFIDYVV